VFVGAEFSPIFVFSAIIILAPDMLARQSRAQKTDDSLESKKLLNQTNGHLGRGPGPGNLSHKIAKTCHHYDVTHREPRTQNEKKF